MKVLAVRWNREIWEHLTTPPVLAFLVLVSVAVGDVFVFGLPRRGILSLRPLNVQRTIECTILCTQHRPQKKYVPDPLPASLCNPHVRKVKLPNAAYFSPAKAESAKRASHYICLRLFFVANCSLHSKCLLLVGTPHPNLGFGPLRNAGAESDVDFSPCIPQWAHSPKEEEASAPPNLT